MELLLGSRTGDTCGCPKAAPHDSDKNLVLTEQLIDDLLRSSTTRGGVRLPADYFQYIAQISALGLVEFSSNAADSFPFDPDMKPTVESVPIAVFAWVIRDCV